MLPVALASCTAWAGTTLVVESWRDDDRAVWEETIVPAFEAAHPGIGLEFRPTALADYDASLAARLEAGEAGDLITCRPFDASLALYGDGHWTCSPGWTARSRQGGWPKKAPRPAIAPCGGFRRESLPRAAGDRPLSVPEVMNIEKASKKT